MKLNLMILSVSVLMFGCSSSQYLVDKPLVIYPKSSSTEQSGEIQQKSMGAVLKAFSDYRWEIRGIDRENSIVTAEACRRGEHCSEVIATIKKDGSVEFIRTEGQNLTKNEGELLRRWLANIRKSYNKHMSSGSL